MEDGIDLADYKLRFKNDLLEKFSGELANLVDAGLVETNDGRLRLTRKGKLFSNEVFEVFV
jgi:oxygen-independent coproporphyrinogen-3 oxidase